MLEKFSKKQKEKNWVKNLKKNIEDVTPDEFKGNLRDYSQPLSNLEKSLKYLLSFEEK